MIDRISVEEFRLRMQRGKPAQPEFHLQRRVALFLDRALPRAAYWCAVPNGARTGKREGAKLKFIGLKAGAPDILIWWQGKSIAIELKAKLGRLSEPQAEAHQRLERAGARVAVCRSVEDVRATLKACGVPLWEEVAA